MTEPWSDRLRAGSFRDFLVQPTQERYHQFRFAAYFQQETGYSVSRAPAAYSIMFASITCLQARINKADTLMLM